MAREMIGRTFGRLVVKSFHEVRGRTDYWNTICQCGKEKVASGHSMRYGNTTSCGCKLLENIKKAHLANTKYDRMGSSDATIRVWENMIQRATNPNNPRADGYSGRGISVCDRWRRFENFFIDMGEKPEGRSLDRIDNDKGYSPSNCRWATPKEQLNNTRKTIWLEWRGEKRTLTQWAEFLNMDRWTLHARFKRKWPIDKMLGAPVKFHRRTR